MAVMQSVYCVEDDENIRELILCALKSGGFLGAGFESAEPMYRYIGENGAPNMFILDIMLPREDGISVLSHLRNWSSTSEVPVMMLTAKGEEYDKVKALDLGADDYMVKPFGIMEFLSRIRAVLRRYSGQSSVPDTLTYQNITLSKERHEATAAGKVCSLTHKEFLVLSVLISNPGIVFSRSKLMDLVWGFDFEGESRTVDMHIKTLRQKLTALGGDDVIVTVRGVGYKLGATPPQQAEEPKTNMEDRE